MIKTAGELRSSTRNKKAIDIEIREILKSMEAKMISANKDGRSNVIFDVPKNYTSVGNDTDATLMIISGVVKQLEGGGYDVKIVDNETIYTFDVRWSSEISQEYRAEMANLISKNMIGSLFR